MKYEPPSLREARGYAERLAQKTPRGGHLRALVPKVEESVCRQERSFLLSKENKIIPHSLQHHFLSITEK